MDPADRRDPRLVSLALTAFAVAFFVALLVAAFGMTSLLTDTDVIDVEGASLLLGPTMSAAAAILVAIRLVGVAVAHVHAQDAGAVAVRIPLVAGLVTGIVASIAYALVGGMLRALATAQPIDLVLFAGRELLRPYAIEVGIIALVVHVAFALVLGLGGEHPRRPLWPWEK